MQYPTNFLVIDFQSQSSQLQSIRYFQIIPHDVEKLLQGIFTTDILFIDIFIYEFCEITSV